MSPDDPAYWMLFDSYTSSTEVYSDSCYICRDPEFAQMGLPLCRKCHYCVAEGALGHVPADDSVCTDCGKDQSDLDLDDQSLDKAKTKD